MALTIPRTVDDLHAAWLRDVLALDVTNVELLDDHSGTSGRARLGVQYAPGEEGPASVFVKLAPPDERQRERLARWGIGVNETRFYESARPGLPVRAPEVYATARDGDEFVMVLEDLVPLGCTFPHPRDPDVVEFTAAFIETLAVLHGSMWESPRFDDDDDLGWVPTRAGGASRGATGGEFIRMALDEFGEEMGPAFRRLGELYLDHGDELLDLYDEGPTTLVHGDAHSGNLYKSPDGSPGLLDWAMVSYQPGMRDVAYYLCNSFPSALRREHEHELLARYRAGLDAFGVTLDESRQWEQYRLFAITSWVAGASTAAMGSRWQPRHVGLGGMRRATGAIEDLDSVGYFESRL